MIFSDYIGKKYGRLLVDAFSHKSVRGATYFHCVCDCGNKSIVSSSNLKCGLVSSCGCLKRELARNKLLVHGKSKSAEYRAWSHIKDRCLNKSTSNYKDYGGRGIFISDEWLSFENFYRDMGDRPSRLHSIERVDNALGYSKNNCRWATRKEQNNNRRSSLIIRINGVSKNLKQWCDCFGLNYGTVHSRISKGGRSISEALGVPNIDVDDQSPS